MVQVRMKDERCSVCGGSSFHHLGCPTLERFLWLMALVLGSVTVLEAGLVLFDGSHADLRPAIALTLLFVVLLFASRWRHKASRRGG
jgi:hypothetical protein